MSSCIRIAGAAALLAGLGACARGERVDFDSIAKHPAPELTSTVGRPVDVQRHYSYMRNTNLRGFWDDLGRTIYTDHPSRLSPYPIIDASGNPR